MPAIDFIDPSFVPFFGTFLFIFAIVFGLLTYSKLMGFSKNVNAAIAFVFGIFAAAFDPLREGLFIFLPIASVFLAILFIFVFIKKIFQPEDKKQSFDAVPFIAIAVPTFFLLGIFSDQILSFLDPVMQRNVLWLTGIFVVIIIFASVYYHGFKAE